jgi:ABC-type branched-subunit amino acid transport system substrate-binding protein
MFSKLSILSAVAAVLALAVALPASASRVHKHRAHILSTSNSAQVVVPRGGAVEVAFTPDLTWLTSAFAASLDNAVQMAVEAHPAIRGFPIQVNVVNTPCGDSTADAAAVASVVANVQNAGVIGPFCSTADAVQLPIYQVAEVVSVSGSTTNPFLPPLGPSVFNSVDVSDSCCPYVDLSDPWYATVETLPSVLVWRQAYSLEFGTAPVAFADLYYDATSLLIRNLQAVSSVDGSGNIVINRAALADSVRHTTKYQGVTCTITLDPSTGYRANDPTALSRCAD